MNLYSLFVALMLVTTPRGCFGGPLGKRGGCLVHRLGFHQILGGRGHICNRETRLVLAVRCQDSSELLYCPPCPLSTYLHNGSGDDNDVPPGICSKGNNFEDRAADNSCQDNGGFKSILTYYTGCYPKDVDF